MLSLFGCVLRISEKDIALWFSVVNHYCPGEIAEAVTKSLCAATRRLENKSVLDLARTCLSDDRTRAELLETFQTPWEAILRIAKMVVIVTSICQEPYAGYAGS